MRSCQDDSISGAVVTAIAVATSRARVVRIKFKKFDYELELLNVKN